MKLLIFVSIPYRHAKNFKYYWCSKIYTVEFQFLIGTLKTADALLPEFLPDEVSIPYRHAKNYLEFSYSDIANYVFQFLIGTLKTTTINLSSSTGKPFQFLIGTLKTKGR